MQPVERLPMRVAIAGAGFASGLHLAGWSRLSDVQIVAICDPDREQARARAREFGIPAVFDDARRMLDASEPDALDVAAPLDAHVPLCRLAADRRVHVLCQKPLAATLREAVELADAVEGRIRLMVHENWRFRAHYRAIRQWLDEGLVGRPVQAAMKVRSSSLVADASGRLPLLARQPSLGRLRRLMIGEVLVHHLDVLRWLLGPLGVVAARTQRRCDAIEGESAASVALEGDGVQVTLDGDFSVRGAPPTPVDELEIAGTNGIMSFNGNIARVTGAHERSQAFDLVAGYADSYAAAIAHFADALATGGPFETDVRDNLATLALVEAAYAKASA